MLQSKLFIPTLREAPAEAEANSHRWLLQAGYIRPLASGIYTYLPLARRVLERLERIIREEMDGIGAQEILMPVLQPIELWQASGREEAYGPEMIRLADRHERAFALGPTHEEVITTLVGNEISSYRGLPVTLYQLQTKFRDERRPRFGLLRGREFMMKDAYSFDTDAAGLAVQYEQMFQAYHRIFTRCQLDYRAVEAEAGAIGGEGQTHEFIALTASGEDTIVNCSSCGFAVNLEIVEEGAAEAGGACPQCSKPTLEHLKGIELGHVFQLGTVYSEKLGAMYTDDTGEQHAMVMGCYGIGVSRLLAAIVEQYHDENGICWPVSVAPFQVHLIPISHKDQAQQDATASLYKELKQAGIDVLLDDREERPGVKFKDSDLLGIPLRIVCGKGLQNGVVELKDRRTGEVAEVPLDQVLRHLLDIISAKTFAQG